MDFKMRVFIYCLFVMAVFSGCNNGKTSEPETAGADTLVADSGIVLGDTVQRMPPRAADGLFDDFIYSFMRNKDFQLDRIVFPLPNYVDGVNHPVTREQWRFDQLYVRQDVYTLIFDDEKSIQAEKDTSLHHVVVEWVYLGKKRVKQYIFDKVDGLWCLTALDTHSLSKNINHDFYEFYNKFSGNMSYQMRHIKNPFYFKTYDADHFQPIEGLLDVEQWPDYRPELPLGTITNINYGQSYGDSHKRVLMLCSPSGGMGCSLVFARHGKSWRLERLEN